VGKELAAAELAKAINCTGGGERPCGACDSCGKTASYQHPDFIYLFPVPHPSAEGDKRKLAEEIAEFLKDKAERSYLQPRFDKAVSISIDDIRELQAKMSLRPYQGARKVALIAGAEAMTVEAANAFLKTLEEPSPTTHFILVTDRPNYLLPTIASRCQKLRFSLLTKQQVEQALRQRHGLNPAEAELLAEVSGGSLGRALEMMDQDLLEDRDSAWELALAAAQRRHCDLLNAVDAIARDKGRPERVLGFISGLASDVLKYRLQGTVAHPDKKNEIETLGKLYAPGELDRLVRNIERARIALGRNVNPRLCLVSACTATQGEDDDPDIG
jgi:DNA polymerase-3 subunit delta'